MPSQEQGKSVQPGKAARWWLALMGVVLFWITGAPDYEIGHVILGVFIVIAIHLAVAFFRRDQAPNAESAAHPRRSQPSLLSNARTLMLLLPVAALGVLGILAGGASAWHAYFCALAIGSLTAMCWFFPSRAKKKDGGVAP